MLTPEEEERITEEVFRTLIETECLVLSGYDSNDEPVYRLTEKCQELFPELYAMHQAEVNQTANELWQMGAISINFTEETESITVTPANYMVLKEMYQSLTEEQISFIEALAVRNKEDKN